MRQPFYHQAHILDTRTRSPHNMLMCNSMRVYCMQPERINNTGLQFSDGAIGGMADDCCLYYHEKQRFAHCAVHTLNNLFQESWLSYADFADIAAKLHKTDVAMGNSAYFSPNPYRSWFPYVGNFDIQCIVEAIKRKNCVMSNHITRVSELSSNNLSTKCDSTVGYIVNKQSVSLFGFRTSNHWFAIIRTGQRFVNIDSQISDPETMATEEDFIQRCSDGILNANWQVFVVTDESDEICGSS